MASADSIHFKYMKRIVHDVQEAASTPGFSVSFIEPDKYDRFYVKHTIDGGIYKGITLVFEIAMRNYPIKPPHLKLVTPSMWHPNISEKGTICVDFLYDENKWSDQYTIVSMLYAFQLLLEDPNTDGGHHNPPASKLWNECKKEGNFEKYIHEMKAKTGKYDVNCDKFFATDSPTYIPPSDKKEVVPVIAKVETSVLAKGFSKLKKPGSK
jgi:ubiquitin-protein ligase